MKLKPRIFNYSETTYGIKEFGAKTSSDRVDVTYYAKVRSKNAMLQRLLKLPNMENATVNWIRERICQGSGGMEQIITDDSIYVKADRDMVIGKFTIDNKWMPFDPPLKPHRPWLKTPSNNKQAEKERKSKMTEKDKLIHRIGAKYTPYEHITKETAFTSRQKQILELRKRVQHLDCLAENYLHRFLKKRKEVIKQIREIP